MKRLHKALAFHFQREFLRLDLLVQDLGRCLYLDVFILVGTFRCDIVLFSEAVFWLSDGAVEFEFCRLLWLTVFFS